MEIIQDIFKGKPIEDAIKGEEPKKHQISKPKKEESPKTQNKKENLQDSKVQKKKWSES